MTETYKGIAISIATKPQGGRWTASAVCLLSPGHEIRAEPPEPDYATEDEARQAALQAAVESIDRARSRIGKP